MLHIILLILKIIGWIVLAILGLFVLLICVVLFVPLRYKGEGRCDGTLDSLYGNIRFSWFLHLVSGFAVYQNKEFRWKIRVAWKTLDAESEEETEDEWDQERTGTPPPDSHFEESWEDEEVGEIEPEVLDTKGEVDNPPPPKKDESIRRAAIDKPAEGVGKKEETAKKAGKPKAWYERILEKVRLFFQKIKYTFRRICGTIRSLVHKKDYLETFITDEVHRSAFKAVLKESIRLLKFLRPRKLNADIHFGFEDPSITGYILAFISMIHPYIGEHTDIHPDFEQQVLEGDLKISGKIKVMYPFIAAWNLFWNKNVRITYKHIRQFKL